MPRRFRSPIFVLLTAIVFAGTALATGRPQKSSGGFDPFRAPRTATPPAKKKVFEPSEIPPPGLTARVASCGEKSGTFGASARTTPCPYLVSEIKFTGIIGGDQLSATAVAVPTNESIILQVGDSLYDGEVVSITEATPEAEAAVVLKRTTYYKAKGGKRAVEATVTLRLQP